MADMLPVTPDPLASAPTPFIWVITASADRRLKLARTVSERLPTAYFETCAPVDARSRLGKNAAEVVIFDLDLMGVDALAQLADTIASHRQARILAIGDGPESIFGERALRAGALGYIMGSEPMVEIAVAINAVREGRVYLSPRIFVATLHRLLAQAEPGATDGIAGLSDRELAVLRLTGIGEPNRTIAEALGVSMKTIEAHKEDIKEKLGVATAAELVETARRWLEISPTGPARS